MLVIKNFYIITLLIFAFIPLILVLYNYPRLIKKFVIQDVLFILPVITYELVAVYLGQWEFRGNDYIGWVNLFRIGFPFEELLFLIFSVPTVLGIYEFFADDLK